MFDILAFLFVFLLLRGKGHSLECTKYCDSYKVRKDNKSM